MVKGLADGATFELTSARGEGTTATIALPPDALTEAVSVEPPIDAPRVSAA